MAKNVIEHLLQNLSSLNPTEQLICQKLVHIQYDEFLAFH